MRVLIMTGGFAGPSRQPWLMDDLAEALADVGHSVEVVVFDSKDPRPRGEQQSHGLGITVFSAGIARRPRGPLKRVRSHIAVAVGLHVCAFRWARQRHYDLCIFTSPALLSWWLPWRLRRAGATSHTLLFLWDFFPIHQLEIGRIGFSWLGRALKLLERSAISGADTVALMSPANLQFFRRYHRGSVPATIQIPPWSSSKPVASMAPDLPPLRVIFGGQITRGRGIDTLLNAAELLIDEKDEIQFWIAGDGPQRSILARRAHDRGLVNVRFYGALEREAYRSLARRAHVGVAITVPGISPPSFPSKIVEYCSLGLPVVVCVESSSDAGEFVARHGAGVAVPAGDALALAEALRGLRRRLGSRELRLMSCAALELFESRFSVRRVVEACERIVG